VLDLGCNAGEYSELAVSAGTQRVIGLERDPEAIRAAVARADRCPQKFLPLQVDVLNLSPSLGWRLRERLSLTQRIHADAVLCLALVHHLSLGAGLPLETLVPGLVELAPTGLIEFVPPSDPMARRIAGPTERLHHPYDLPRFLDVLARGARIVKSTELAPGGRVLVEYCRHANS
jgi:hypothetical protein